MHAERLVARWLAIAILSAFGVLATLGVSATQAGAQSYDAAEMETVELINAYRQENGLGTLSLSAPLSVASERHSEDMGTYGFFSHDTVQSSYYQPGWGHSERIAQEGYDYNTYTAENLAYGQATPQEVFEAWRNSPGHNAAMLGDYSVVGIGLVNVGGVPYWTTVFGAEADPSAQPVGAAPSSGGTDPGGNAAAEEEPTAASGQYDDAPDEDAPDDAASGQYDNDPALDADPVAAEDQYDDATGEESPVTEQYEEGSPEPADTTVSDQYQQEADRFRAAADQYGEEAREAEREIAALQAEQTNAPAANAPAANASAQSVGTVSPEPQIAAPESAAREIPAPNVEAASTTDTTQSGGSEKPSEAMASVGMVVLPDTGGLPLGNILGAALVACVLVVVGGGARRFIK